MASRRNEGSAAVGSSTPLPQLHVRVLERTSPIANAEVRLYENTDPDHSANGWRTLQSVRADANGIATFAAPRGKYLIAARAADGRIGRTVIDNPGTIAERTVEVQLSAPVEVALNLRDARTKEPVALARVELLQTGLINDSQWQPSLPPDERVEGSADPHGVFGARGLVPGSYRLSVMADGYEPWRSELRVPLDQPMDIELQGAAFLTGFVRDSDGQPVEAAKVWAEGTRPGDPVQTGSGGGFSLEVARGVYRIFARDAHGVASTASQLVIGARETRSGIELVLDRAASVRGKVTIAEDGGAVPECVARIVRGVDHLDARCDAGVFEAQGLAPGAAEITVTAPGFAKAKLDNVMLTAGQLTEVEVALSRPSSITGHVTNPDGKPIAGALVRVVGAFVPSVLDVPVQTGADGAYRLDEVPPGRVTVRAWQEPATVGTEQTVHLSAGETARVDLTLNVLGVVEGTVTRKDGKPLDPDTLVYAKNEVPPFGNRSWGTKVEPDGHYRLSLPAGDWKLTAARRNSYQANVLMQSEPVKVIEGKTVRLDLEVAPEFTGCSGIVLEPGGAPAARASVMIRGSSSLTTATADDGRFTQGLSIKEKPNAELIVARKDGRFGQLIPKHGCEDVRVQLKRSAQVSGRVIDDAGHAIDAFEISIGMQNPPVEWWSNWGTYRFSGDAFSLDDVPSTDVTLTVKTIDGRRGTASVSLDEGGSATVDVHVVPSARIRGRVLASKTRTPPPNGQVLLSTDPTHAGEMRMIAADGTFEWADLPAGKYTVRGAAAKLNTVTREISLEPGQTLELGDLMLDEPQPEHGSIGAHAYAGSMTTKTVRLYGVQPEGPAARAGARDNDVILAIDGVPPTSLMDAAMRLHGEPASWVKLKLGRGDETLELAIQRTP